MNTINSVNSTSNYKQNFGSNFLVIPNKKLLKMSISNLHMNGHVGATTNPFFLRFQCKDQDDGKVIEFLNKVKAKFVCSNIEDEAYEGIPVYPSNGSNIFNEYNGPLRTSEITEAAKTTGKYIKILF